MKKKWVWIALLAVAILAGLGAWLTSTREPGETAAKGESAVPTPSRVGADVLRYPEDAPQLSMIQSQSMHLGPVPLTETLSGRLVYDEDVTARIGVGISGRIVTIKAEPGDRVKAGQVLAEIDSPDVGTAYADLDKARADEERKRLAFKRAKELVPGEAIAVRDWEAAEADYTQARAERERAERRVKNLNPFDIEVVGQRIRLTSPVSGVVTERNATPALEVSPSLPAPLFVVTDPKRLWLMIDVPERLLGTVKKGNEVGIESDAYINEQFIGKIVQIGQVVDPNTRRVPVRARVANADEKLLPEMFVRTYALRELGEGVCVPNSAIINEGVYAFVYVEVPRGIFHRRKVTLVTRGGDFSCVGEGLEGSEKVVTTGALLLDAELTAGAGDKP